MYAFQLTYGFMAGDAISNHVLEIDARLRAWGYETDIFAQYVAPEMRHRAKPDRECLVWLDRSDILIIYHYSIYTPNLYFFQAARARKILIYHNITPAHFFRGWDAKAEMECRLGRRALTNLTDCDFALGDTDFNRRELVAAGFPAAKTGVLPIFLTQEYFESLSVDQSLHNQLRQAETAKWLTVGRVVPNKGLDDLIRLFYVYNQNINSQSRLYIVGSRYIPLYDEALDELVKALGLTDRVIFTGRVSDAELIAYYQAADLYVTASRHEGFCVPLIESMYFGLPILARKSTAIPETLGDAGVLFTELGYEQTAEMAHLLVTDNTLRNKVIAKQKERLQMLSPAYAEAALQKVLGRFTQLSQFYRME